MLCHQAFWEILSRYVPLTFVCKLCTICNGWIATVLLCSKQIVERMTFKFHLRNSLREIRHKAFHEEEDGWERRLKKRGEVIKMLTLWNNNSYMHGHVKCVDYLSKDLSNAQGQANRKLSFVSERILTSLWTEDACHSAADPCRIWKHELARPLLMLSNTGQVLTLTQQLVGQTRLFSEQGLVLPGSLENWENWKRLVDLFCHYSTMCTGLESCLKSTRRHTFVRRGSVHLPMWLYWYIGWSQSSCTIDCNNTSRAQVPKGIILLAENCRIASCLSSRKSIFSEKGMWQSCIALCGDLHLAVVACCSAKLVYTC